MIRLSWDSPQTARRVWLFDRPNPKDHILSGVLLFSDGTAIRVGELPNDARSAREIVFPAKTITWVVFAVDTVSPETVERGSRGDGRLQGLTDGTGEACRAPRARSAGLIS